MAVSNPKFKGFLLRSASQMETGLREEIPAGTTVFSDKNPRGGLDTVCVWPETLPTLQFLFPANQIQWEER